MQQKVAIARALLTSPVLLLLDEPTTGLDPRSKREVQDFVLQMRQQHDTTVLLTTHDMDEADRLCDRIAVIDHGRNLIDDTPAGLKRRMGADRLEIVAADPADLPVLQQIIEAVADGEAALDEGASSVSAPVSDPVAALTAAATAVQDKRLTVADIGLRRPTLDEAFLELIAKEDQ